MCQLPRGKSFCASYLEDVDVESIKKLHASVPTVPLPLPETLSSLDAGLDESSEGHDMRKKNGSGQCTKRNGC